jgi:hypothetical protein
MEKRTPTPLSENVAKPRYAICYLRGEAALQLSR